MKKYFTFALIAVFAIMLILFAFPQSCEKPSELQVKSDKSLKADSIQRNKTNRQNIISDSLVKIYRDSIAVLHAKNEKLSVNYYALRAKIKHLKTVKVDSSIFSDTTDQLKKWIEIEQYNAFVNSGTMCDSLLMYQDSELMLKDSIISVREIQVNSLIKKIETGDVANADLLALVEELKQELKRCKNQNKALKIALLIDTLLHFAH